MEGNGGALERGGDAIEGKERFIGSGGFSIRTLGGNQEPRGSRL
jgi:hypothetical protein